MAEDVKIGGNSDGGNNKTVKKSPFSKNPNGLIRYFISLHSQKRWSFLNNFGYDWGSWLGKLPKAMSNMHA